MAVTPRADVTALIPEEVRREIVQDVAKGSAVLSLPGVTRYTAQRNQVRIPVLTTLPTVGWVAEGSTKAESTAAWESEFLYIEELAGIVRVHENVLMDADYDVWGEIQPRLSADIGRKLDQAILFGTNAPVSFGDSIAEGAAGAGNTVAYSAADVAERTSLAMGEVEEDGFMVNGMVARVGVKHQLRNLRDDQNQPIFSTSLQNDGRTDSVWGEQIEFVDNGSWDNDAADIIVGDWSKLIVAIRQDITFKVSDTAVVGGQSTFERDEVALRVVFRCGYYVMNPLTDLNDDGDTRYPFATVLPEGGS